MPTETNRVFEHFVSAYCQKRDLFLKKKKMAKLQRYQKSGWAYVFLLVLIFNGLSCHKEEAVMQRRLVKIHTGSPGFYTKYAYLPDGKLSQIVSYSHDKPWARDIMYYNLDNKVVKRTHFLEKENRITNLDSFFYDNKGRVSAIKYYSIFFRPELQFAWYDTFYYDAFDHPVRIDEYTYVDGKEVDFNYLTYEWEDGNLIHTINYFKDGRILDETTYYYDDHPGYNTAYKSKIYGPASVSKNNVIKYVYDGHGNGFSDPCSTCTYEIVYDEYGYMISRFLKGDGTVYFEYESY